MSHAEQQAFCQKVRSLHPQFFSFARVLDVGSLDINGSNRTLFRDCLYLGVDVGPGNNVDLVCPIHEFELEWEFDVIVSTECFEHDMHYELSLRRIVELLRPGGLFFFTCAGAGRAEHGTRRSHPDDSPLTSAIESWGDYYKNLTPDDIRAALPINDIFRFHYFEENKEHGDTYFWGIKKDRA